MTVDLSNLAAPEVVETIAFEAILADIKADLVARYPDAAEVIDLESEPMVKLMEAFAYRELLLRARYNDEARALLLAYATGANLDHIGATYYDEARLVVTPADTTVTPPVEAAMEKDADYRARLQLKPESWSTAGPRDAYKWFAMSASGQVKDVSVTTPEGGTTQIYVLTASGNGLPAADLLATVSGAVNDEKVRPLSELVVVSAPTIVNYAIDVSLTLFPGPSGEVVLDAVQDSLQALVDKLHVLGGDVVHSAIDAAAHLAGIKKVVVNSPAADVVCTDAQAPWCTGITVTVAGIES